MKSTIISLSTLGLVLTFAPSASKAQPNPNPPGQMSYQGFLTDANGFPLATNNPVNYNVEFRIWNQPSGGANPLWGELQVVTVDRGYFTVLLGNGSSLAGGVPFTNNLAGIFSGSDASDRYLEMTVMGLAIQPRLRLLTTPYSFMASSALSVPDNGLSTNVALRAGPNTFSGNQTITGGSIYMDNGAEIFAKNSSGAYEDFLYPRWTDDITYLDYGSGGFNIRNNTYNSTMFMKNGNVGIGTTIPSFPLSFPQTLGDKISLWGDSGNHFGFGIQGRQLQIYTDVSLSDIVFGYGQSASLTETMRIKGNGNVGIGAPIPLATLHVNSASYPSALIDGQSTVGTWLTLRNTASGGTNWMLIATASGNGEGAGKLLFNYGGSPGGVAGNTLTLVPGGLVGIGTTTPAVPLDVESSVNQTASYGWLNVHGQTSTASGNNPYSIKAGQRIMASEFNAVSDSRIKEIIGQSDRQADLEIIEKLRVTDFYMKDRVANGDTPRKGFIAQEVETVIPEAVTKSRQFVPDIYALASGAKFDPAGRTIAVKLAKAHGLKTGDRVRLMTETGQLDLPVSSVSSEGEFVAANCEKEPKQVFVFGKEVNDFRTLNYDRIFTTGISAMQELARRVSTLEAHEAEHVALEKRAARVDELEHEVADLKAVVGRLAKSQSHQASARGVSRQEEAASDQSGALLAADNAAVTQQPSTSQPGEL